jgi:mRNA interferase RelE/StbE
VFAVDILPKAERQLRKIRSKDSKAFSEISAGIDSLVNYPKLPNIKKLTNHDYEYRLRVGRYRVFFDVKNEIRVIAVQEVKKRDDHTY